MKALRTERLILRRIQVSDAQRIFDCWASKPEVTQYLTWHAHDSIAQTQQVMAYWLSEYVKPDCYRYGIVCADTDELIGMIDVVGYRAGIPEIGYCSGPAYWGKGYMTEAVKAVTAQLFEEGYPASDVRADRCCREHHTHQAVKRENNNDTKSALSPQHGSLQTYK